MAMREAGATIERRNGEAHQIYLVTTDPEVARKYETHLEEEFLSTGEEGFGAGPEP